MHILILSPEMPYPPTSGGRLRVFKVLKELAASNDIYLISFYKSEEDLRYKEKLLTYCKDVHLVPLPLKSFPDPRGNNDTFRNHILANKIRWYFSLTPAINSYYFSQEFQSSIDRFLERYPIEIIQFEHSYIDQYRYKNLIHKKIKKVLVQYNVEHDLYRQRMEYVGRSKSVIWRLKARLDSLTFKKFELNKVKDQDLCIMVSEEDKKQLASLLPDSAPKTIVVPNGVDIDYIKPVLDPATRDQQSLVFTAGMFWFPNEDGLLWFAESIFPKIAAVHPHLRIFVAGKEPSEKVKALQMKDSRYVITGYVDDIRDYLYRGTVFICPLRLGGGTKVKILEAMASGIPVVSTVSGSKGIKANDHEHILIAKNEEEFAKKVLALLRQPELRKELASNARRLVEETYSWKRIVAEYEKELKKMLSIH
ncbi:glycosyltransferase family 4 protein [Brevibacillus borstelensis]|uniref:glycosyltransferase family 4 protein n=1 Tax=Brevibacillus borstelensis TaxID=45462 RepID=UPI0030BF971E